MYTCVSVMILTFCSICPISVTPIRPCVRAFVHAFARSFGRYNTATKLPLLIISNMCNPLLVAIEQDTDSSDDDSCFSVESECSAGTNSSTVMTDFLDSGVRFAPGDVPLALIDDPLMNGGLFYLSDDDMIDNGFACSSDEDSMCFSDDYSDSDDVSVATNTTNDTEQMIETAKDMMHPSIILYCMKEYPNPEPGSQQNPIVID